MSDNRHSGQHTQSDQPNHAREIQIGEVQHNEKLKKSFSLWSATGLMAASQGTPLVLGSLLALVVGVGGSPVFVYGYFIGCFFNLVICLSLAEIASAYPSPAGQIYWVAVIANNRHSRWLSYITGWMVSAGWFFWFTATNLFTAMMLFATFEIFNPAWTAAKWQIFLVLVGVNSICALINFPLFKLWPRITTAMLYWLNLGALFIFVSLLARTHPKQSAHTVFIEVVNGTGWGSTFVVFCIGLIPGAAAVSAFDCVTHMADEVLQPERVVPLVMLGSSTLSFIAGIPMLFTYMFCIVKPDNLLAPIGGIPVVQIFWDAYNSRPLVVVSSMIIIIGELGAGCAVLCTVSRTWWAFAELKGVPFSGFFSHISDRWLLPVNSIMFLAILGTGVGALNMASTTALNALLSSGAICVYLSYLVPLLTILSRGRSTLPKARYFNLKKAGPILNIVGALWIMFMSVWMCFPLYMPVTLSSMNYTVVVMCGVVFIALVTWFTTAKNYFIVPRVAVRTAVDVNTKVDVYEAHYKEDEKSP